LDNDSRDAKQGDLSVNTNQTVDDCHCHGIERRRPERKRNKGDREQVDASD
jgi:hypothetical protein